MKFTKQIAHFLFQKDAIGSEALPHGLNSCHASTIIVLPESQELLVAFFAGQKEGAGDTAIWLSRYNNGNWLPPVRTIFEAGLAHWNPVLHREQGVVWLFYKVGSNVHNWQTRYVCSYDNGAHWNEPNPLVAQDSLPRGPVKNKLLVMSNGEWLAPASIETDQYWDAFVDISADQGQNWQKCAVPIQHQNPQQAGSQPVWQGLKNDALWETDLTRVFGWDGVIQPTLWESERGHIHMLLRTTRGRIYRSDSIDYGRHWCPAYATDLPNNNSGIDLVRLENGTLVLAYNPIEGNWNRRYPISLSYSEDNGMHWSVPFDLEGGEGEFSYPAIITEGKVIHVTYTWNRSNFVYQSVLFH